MRDSVWHMRRALGLMALATAGCGSPTGSKGGTGSLTVTIVPAEATPSVVVSGPNSYSKTISSTQTLGGLAPGLYTIVADSVVATDSIIGTYTDTGNVSVTPVAVVAGVTHSISVTYAIKDRVGALWVANNFYQTIGGLAANQLRLTSPTVPADTLATSVGGPAGLALDPAGNMWVSSWSSDSLVMYTPAARNNSAGSAPSRVIVSGALDNPNGIAFDAHGSLWVANCFGGNILGYSAGQLAAGGSQAPEVTISGGGGGHVICPYALAFDANGNVWVADDSADHIVEYSAAQLAVAGSSTPTPINVITSNSGSLALTDAVVFDASGNLWVANDSIPTVVSYTPAQLAAGGSPVPTIITLPATTDPYGLAFDIRGTLWVSDYANSILYGLSKGQLAATGSPPPSVTLGMTLNNLFLPQQPLFDPYATPPLVFPTRVRTASPMARPAGGRMSRLSRRHRLH
jgi:sugar lactone lactonase YvrE